MDREPIFLQRGRPSRNRTVGGATSGTQVSDLRRTEDRDRLTRLEVVVETVLVEVEDLLRELERQADEIKGVSDIQKQMLNVLKTIKWVVIGGVAGLLASEMGIFQALVVTGKVAGVLPPIP